MKSSDFRVRRATLDDLPQLNALWQSMHFNVEEMGRRVTEFQVAESGSGRIVGALAVQLAERHGRVHSEAFTDFALADQLRPMLWERVNSIATNHGLLRLWTQEKAPFWHHCGLSKPDAEALEKLPAPWRALTRDWLTLKLKDDIDALTSMDHEFARFMETEKQRTMRVLQRGRMLKVVATLVALAVLALVLGAVFYMIRMNPHLFRH